VSAAYLRPATIRKRKSASTAMARTIRIVHNMFKVLPRREAVLPYLLLAGVFALRAGRVQRGR
jgi:hypothetical protein